MKKHFLFAIAGISLMASSILLTSCDTKQGIEVKFNQDMVQIMELLPTSQLRIDTTLEVVSNLDSLLTANDATRDDLGSMTLTSIEVGICDSLGNDDYTKNFNEFDSVGVRVFVANDNSVPDVLVAQASVPQNLWGFGVALTAQDFDFIPYATKNKFNLKYMTKLNTAITAKKYVKVKVRINVGVNI